MLDVSGGLRSGATGCVIWLGGGDVVDGVRSNIIIVSFFVMMAALGWLGLLTLLVRTALLPRYIVEPGGASPPRFGDVIAFAVGFVFYLTY